MIRKQLFHLGFSLGVKDTFREIYLGTYSSRLQRERAIRRYREAVKRNDYRVVSFLKEGEGLEDGNFYEFETELNVDVLLKNNISSLRGQLC